MSIKIPIETSARHLHISQEDFEKLFGEGSKPHFIKELSQPAVSWWRQFAESDIKLI